VRERAAQRQRPEGENDEQTPEPTQPHGGILRATGTGRAADRGRLL
jgi:hypothetical protein